MVTTARTLELGSGLAPDSCRAFDALYSKHRRELLRFCVLQLGDRDEAEDVVQEAFTRAYTALDRYDGGRPFYPWLKAIARRLCVDAHRRRSRTRPTAEVDVGQTEGGQEAVLDAADRATLRVALSSLGPRHREVLALREHHGWSYQRIADHYMVTIGTVEQLLWRARRALRREFQALAGPGGRLASVPIVGAAARWVHAMKERLDAQMEQAVLVITANAVSVVMAVTSVAVLVDGPAAASAPPPVAASANSWHAGVPGAAGTEPGSAATPERADRGSPGLERTGVTGPGPMRHVGPLLVGNEAQAREESKDHPIRLEPVRGGPWVTANPAAVVDPVMARIATP